MGRRIVTVIGGYEVANEPEIAYGNARNRLPKAMARLILKCSDRVLAVSLFSQRQIQANLPILDGRLEVIHHGFEDLATRAPRMHSTAVVTVSHITEETWMVKGIYDFILTAEQMPDIRFVHIGRQHVDIRAKLGRDLPANLTLMGEVPFEQLGETLASAKVYLQLSRHESFGCSVAEGMLCGCIPVVADAAALPEVVGDCGIVLKSREIADVVSEVRRALGMPESEGERARERVLERFSYAKRRVALLQVIDQVTKK